MMTQSSSPPYKAPVLLGLDSFFIHPSISTSRIPSKSIYNSTSTFNLLITKWLAVAVDPETLAAAQDPTPVLAVRTANARSAESNRSLAGIQHGVPSS